MFPAYMKFSFCAHEELCPKPLSVRACSELGGTVDIESAPRAVVDNTFDLHHMMYVHASSFGGGELIRTWKPDPLTICFEYGMNQRSNPFSKFFGDGRVLVTMQRSPPYSAMVTVGDPKGATVLKTLTHVVPVSSTKSKLVWQVSARHLFMVWKTPCLWLVASGGHRKSCFYSDFRGPLTPLRFFSFICLRTLYVEHSRTGASLEPLLPVD